jgi:hypothetical protein
MSTVFSTRPKNIRLEAVRQLRISLPLDGGGLPASGGAEGDQGQGWGWRRHLVFLGLFVSPSPFSPPTRGGENRYRTTSLSLALVFLCFFSSWSPALADTLTIEIQASLAVQENTLEGTITVVNRGDEPSRNVHAEFAVPGETIVKEVVDLLEVQQAASFSFKKSLGQTMPGTYAVPIIVVFHDAKLYPFSALACPTFTLGETLSPGLSCSKKPQDKDGEIAFELKNLESSARQIKSLFLFPREFYCPRPEILFDLAPLERKTLSYSLLRATAIPGARYPVFSILEFQSEKGHHCLVCPGEIRFMEGGNWFKRTRWYWLAGWLSLMGMTLGFLVRKRI